MRLPLLRECYSKRDDWRRGGGRDGEVLVRVLVSPSSWFSYSFFYMNFLEASHFRSIDFDFTR